MWIVCLADNSSEMKKLIYSEKYMPIHQKNKRKKIKTVIYCSCEKHFKNQWLFLK